MMRPLSKRIVFSDGSTELARSMTASKLGYGRVDRGRSTTVASRNTLQRSSNVLEGSASPWWGKFTIKMVEVGIDANRVEHSLHKQGKLSL